MAVKSNRRDTCNLLIGLSGNGIKKISEPRQGRDKLRVKKRILVARVLLE